MSRRNDERDGAGRTTTAALTMLALLAVALIAPASGGAQSPQRHDIGVFADVPDNPGLPEGIATDSAGDVFVATNPGGNNPGPQNGQPSVVLRYSPDGELVRQYPVSGQNLAALALPAYGMQALAFDGNDQLYGIDKVPARVIRIDPKSDQQTDYVKFPDVPMCSAPGADQAMCSDTVEDLAPFPNYMAFAPDGSLYVSDFQQALIWRVPPGGGKPRVAFTSSTFDGGMGPNGVQFAADGTTLLIAVSLNPPNFGTPGAGRIDELNIRKDGTGENLRTLYESRPGDGPDGFAIAKSGRIYLNFFLMNQVVVISPEGREITRVPANAVANLALERPLDSPASSVFVGKDLLITNHAVLTRNPASFAVLDLFADEPGLPLFRPQIESSQGRSMCRGTLPTIRGTAGADQLRGTRGTDVILAGAGDDTLSGLRGDDLLCGGAGRDRVRGGSGADRLFGGSGRDRLDGGGGNDRCLETKGVDSKRSC